MRGLAKAPGLSHLLAGLVLMAMGLCPAGAAPVPGAGIAPEASRPAAPPLVAYRLWLLALGAPVDVQQVARASIPGGDAPRLISAESVPDRLNEAVIALLTDRAGGLESAHTRVEGMEEASGRVVGSLGVPIRIAMRTVPILGAPAAAIPDLRETAFTLELVPLGIDPAGRVQTRVDLKAGAGQSPLITYRHTLWLEPGRGAPLAFVLAGESGQSYALGLSAELAEEAPPGAALFEAASLAPIEERFSALLAASTSRPSPPPPPPLHLWLKAAMDHRGTVWEPGLRQPLPGGWSAVAAAAWRPGENEGTVNVALRPRLLHELDLLLGASLRVRQASSPVPAVALGLTEVTRPLPGLVLEALYLPFAYRREEAGSWARVASLWYAGARWTRGSWGLHLSAGLMEPGEPVAQGAASVAVAGGWTLEAGYRASIATGRGSVVAGVAYRLP